MFDEYDHLLILSKKYKVSPLLIGTFYGLSFSLISMIEFEMFLKEFKRCKTQEETSLSIHIYMLQRLKRIKEGIENASNTN